MHERFTPAVTRSRFRWGRAPAVLVAAVLSLAALPPGHAVGEASWPAKPIQAVVAFPAGGISDVLMRTVAAKLAPVFGQPIVVDVRPGADGNIAAEFVARAPADGHTWLLTSVPFTVQPTLRPQSVRYDPIKDFEPVALISSSLNVFAVPASLPVSTLQEFVAYAKSRKTPLTFASPGNGTGSHLGMELFKRTAGIDLVHVPYKGQPPAIVDLIEGRVDSASMAISLAVPHLKSGKLKALAVIDSERSPQLPDVPTIVEAGYPDAVAGAWQVLFVPENTPKPIVKRINEEIMQALKSPDVIAQLKSMGLTPAKPNTPEDVERLIASEIVRWAKIVKDAHIVAE